jgi:hypothetical protein
MTTTSNERVATGWVGFVVFAGTMMVILGTFHVIAGLVAIFKDQYYLVSKSHLVVTVDYTVWGWTHLVLGAIVIAAGLGLIAAQTWARVVAIVLAGLSAVLNISFLAAYPIWAAMMIGFDVLVIWALTVHGQEMRYLE